MSNSRKAIRQEVVRSLQGPYIFESTCSTNTNANLAILGDYLSSILNNTMFVGNFLYCSYDAAGTSGAPEGEYKRIASYAASTGTFTLDSATTAAITASDKVELHTKIHPTVIHECIDRALRKMLYPSLAVPSLMADADMEASGTTAYTAAAGATLAKNTTAANVFRGGQSLSVTADSGADGGDRYAYQQFNVMVGQTYYVFAVCRNSAAATSCKIEAYDATSGATIAHADSTVTAWGGLGFEFTIPASCELMDIRLYTPTASGVSYWDHVGLYQADGRRFALPTWVTDKWQVGGMFYQPEDASLVADTTVLDTMPPERWEGDVIKEGGIVYVVPDPPFNCHAPIYVRALKPYSALATDAATTDADLDWVTAKTKLECRRLLRETTTSAEERRIAQQDFAEAEQEASALDRRFMPKIDHPWGFGEGPLWGLREIGR